jgi:(p)ppGpp synthase/HD superfamily hydrolase
MTKFITAEYAKYFAIGCHGQPKRKYTNEPYWTHCKEVVSLLAEHYPVIDAYIVGWLHDVVEDTWATCFDIEEYFGKRIAMYVSDLTMPSHEAGNRKTRIDIYTAQLSNSCELVQTVKYADLIHNTATIEKYDPDFAKIYLEEKRQLLPKINKGNTRLYNIALKQCGLPGVIE